MSETHSTRASMAAAVSLAISIALPLVYVLSYHPVRQCVRVAHSPKTPGWLEAYGAPAELLRSHLPPWLQEMDDNYLRWWAKRTGYHELSAREFNDAAQAIIQ